VLFEFATASNFHYSYLHFFSPGPCRSFHNLYLSLVYDSDNLKERCQALFSTKRTSSFLIYGDVIRVFIIGLAVSKIFRQTGDAVWADRAQMCIEQMQNWVNQGVPWNFKQKVCICMQVVASILIQDLTTHSCCVCFLATTDASRG
jgi:wobble nucleotide-excising tRNase